MKQYFLSYYIRFFLTQFLANERGLSGNTIQAYRDALKLLLHYCDERLNLRVDRLPCDRINDKIVRGFLDYLEQQRGCCTRSRNARLAALKTFFYYLGREVPECLEICRKISSISQKKVPYKTAQYLDTDEFNAILTGIDIASRNGIRDKALLLLMYNTGARVQEIVDIELNDLRLDAASQVRLSGKGNKQRACPLYPETIEALQAYIAVRKPKQKEENHLFLNDKGESITRFGIRYIVGKYTDKAIEKQPSLKQKKVGPHTIRHTTAMHLLQAGNDLNVVRLWLGHANLNTTHMYADIDMEMKRKILEKSQPPVLKQVKKTWNKPNILEWLDELCERTKLCEV